MMKLELLALVGLLVVWVFSSREGEIVLVKTYLRKCLIVVESLLFMIYSNDSKGTGAKYASDPEKMKDLPTVTKTVVFIRHGESDWNKVFNKGINLSFPFRLINAFVNEALLTFQMDSVFLDSPLNDEGIEQALELRKFLQAVDRNKDPVLGNVAALMLGEQTGAVVASSTLRRSIATTLIALWPRFQDQSRDKIHLLSSLQEIARNVDTRSLSSPNHVANLPFQRVAKHCEGSRFGPQDVLDASENFGNKARSFYGGKRLHSFADWVFKRDEAVVIVGGHSLWFKYFFQLFLPPTSTHDAKSKKMVNAGVVSFSLKMAVDVEGTTLYSIDPGSIQIIYGGFEGKK